MCTGCGMGSPGMRTFPFKFKIPTSSTTEAGADYLRSLSHLSLPAHALSNFTRYCLQTFTNAGAGAASSPRSLWRAAARCCCWCPWPTRRATCRRAAKKQSPHNHVMWNGAVRRPSSAAAAPSSMMRYYVTPALQYYVAPAGGRRCCGPSM